MLAPAACDDPSTPLFNENGASTRVFVKIKRKREDTPLDYLVWDEARSILGENNLTPSKKSKTFKQTSSPQVFVLSETINESVLPPLVEGIPLQTTCSANDRSSNVKRPEKDVIQLKESRGQIMIAGAGAMSHEYVDENRHLMQMHKSVKSSAHLRKLAKTMKSSLTIRDDRDSDDEQEGDDDDDEEEDSYEYDIYYLDPTITLPAGHNIGTLHIVFDNDKDLYSENEAENDLYVDDDDSNAEERAQNEYPDEEDDREIDSEGHYYDEDDENQDSDEDTSSSDEDKDGFGRHRDNSDEEEDL